MMDLRPVANVVGIVLCLLAMAMLAPAALDAALGYGEWQVFLASSGLTLFIGLVLVLATWGSRRRAMNVRQAFLATALGWLVPCIFAALPLAHGDSHLAAIDAFFEATSGITTTGATVIAGLDRMPPGLLLWRGLLQWLGGIGIILMAVAVFPGFNIGGMQMFRIELLAANERATPRATRIATTIALVYASLTLAVALALWAAGMRRFDALVHAMSTVSTGGFGNYDTSLARFGSGAIDMIVLVGMVLGGAPFLLFFQAAQGNWKKALRDQQLHWYLALLALGGAAIALWLVNSRAMAPLDALRHGAFTAASVMTGTGLVTNDYSDWTGLPLAILFFLTFVGGCAGSTSSGIKVFRFQFLFADAWIQVRHLLRPHAVMIPSYNGKPIAKETLSSVMGFLFVYALSFAVLAMLLAFMGLDFLTALSGAASALANLGPGLGETIGPGSTFATLPDAAKLVLALGMLFGRLELLVFLVMFLPNFWRD